ncbi:hypothetical protein [Oceanobacillus rekensis]|uniref:hypothetical protein n=1 Tax=Oceanobacillus rekensis TaxID=937927 RepID=UPI00159302FF|nr:hypothetical protein [Oceanobacillus rekensis]
MEKTKNNKNLIDSYYVTMEARMFFKSEEDSKPQLAFREARYPYTYRQGSEKNGTRSTF